MAELELLDRIYTQAKAEEQRLREETVRLGLYESLADWFYKNAPAEYRRWAQTAEDGSEELEIIDAACEELGLTPPKKFRLIPSSTDLARQIADREGIREELERQLEILGKKTSQREGWDD